MHNRADSGASETRGAVKTLRTVQIVSSRLGVHGVADVVELHGKPPQPLPVEYKRGRPKSHRADEVQLCAQGICLEEMFSCEVPEGELFYGQNRRRQTIVFDGELRELTAETALAARAAMASGAVPRPVYEPGRCDACSLFELCRPKDLAKPRDVPHWLARAVTSSVVPE